MIELIRIETNITSCLELKSLYKFFLSKKKLNSLKAINDKSPTYLSHEI